jgi:dTDP-4-dehydrorhamnose reductase
MTIVIIGSGGRLGAALAREWKRAGDEIIGFNHAALDVGDWRAVWAALEPIGFDAIVNCAALTNVDYCESHEEEAFRINAVGPTTLADLCARKGARMIHISTDYVFGGEKRTPYVEEDVPQPLGFYAASKLAGENALLGQWPQHFVARVSWVFGPDRPSFVDQILKRALESEDLAAIADKIAVPTYTLDVAQWLHPFLAEVREGGLLHLCNAGACSWQEYGQFAVDCAVAGGAPLKGRIVAPQKMADLKAFVAERPVYTVMSTAKLTRLTGITPRSWQDAVEDYVRHYWIPANAPDV